MKRNDVIALALLLCGPFYSAPSFAMKRPNPSLWQISGLASDTIQFLATFAKIFLTNQLHALESYDPYREHEDFFTLVSSSGEEFQVPVQNLHALGELSPTIGDFLSDLEGSGESTLPLNLVGSHALHLLVQMASGNYDLKSYISSLTCAELEKLRDDAQFLDSKVLKNLLASLGNPFELQCEDTLHEICKHCGPIVRTRLRSVSTAFKIFIDMARLPKPLGGLGWTDTLPVVATIDVSLSQPRAPTVFGSLLFVMSNTDLAVSVIDPTQGYQVIQSLKFGDVPAEPVLIVALEYIANPNRTISVIDPAQEHQVIHTIRFERSRSVRLGSFLYIADIRDGTVRVIDPSRKRKQVVRAIAFGDAGLQTLVATDSILYIAKYNEDSIWVVDPPLGHKVIKVIRVGNGPVTPAIVGSFLYVPNHDEGTLSVISLAQNHEVIHTIEVGQGAHSPVVLGTFLYVANRFDDTVSVIDLGGYISEL